MITIYLGKKLGILRGGGGGEALWGIGLLSHVFMSCDRSRDRFPASLLSVKVVVVVVFPLFSCVFFFYLPLFPPVGPLPLRDLRNTYFWLNITPEKRQTVSSVIIRKRKQI